ncbi:hypothetical protein NUW58_g4113 [Xylaria curta]|uniref:Uncharacterized protein n=1 Tax=Xylaria curta TaxID=42375 RepID=A0ACC1PAJ9_9PEZI|nr:hypothetical protein NUW58_g4113 [Xylaria curta]
MSSNRRKRIWKEVKDANADFFNLRTVIALAPDDDFSQFYFVMSPNDGLMAHMTVAGCLYIPDTYPESPPVVHLYTKTGRYNVDVYSGNLHDKTRSTLCFDILRSQANGGVWKPEYSISSLFASLMSAIVSFYVPQQRGGEIAEYVSMEKLDTVKKAAKETYEKYKHLLPIVPKIPLVEATAVPAKQMSFPSTITTEGNTQATSGPIYLQSPDSCIQSFAMDLSELHAGIVFSVILSNSEGDLVGKKPGTILVRNGVTATAARKRANEKTKWFYHGKPMNDGDMRLHVTIGRDQMTFAYCSNGRRYVHGDCPVSRLTDSQIGDVRGIPFYVHVYLKRKSGGPAKVTWLDTEGQGYIHTVRDQMGETNEDIDDDFGFELVDGLKVVEDMKQSEESRDLLVHMSELSLTDNGATDDGGNNDVKSLRPVDGP